MVGENKRAWHVAFTVDLITGLTFFSKSVVDNKVIPRSTGQLPRPIGYSSIQ